MRDGGCCGYSVIGSSESFFGLLGVQIVPHNSWCLLCVKLFYVSCFGLLCLCTKVEHRLLAEVDSVASTSSLSLEDMPRFPYVNAIVKETLRLVPPAPNIGRMAVKEVTVGGYVIPKGTYVFVDAFSIHRDPQLYAKPHEFAPERFLPGGEAVAEGFPPCAYIPFGAGPRKCLGYKFALLELTLAVVRIYKEFVFRLCPEQVEEDIPNMTMGISLAAARGIRVHVVRR